MYICRRKEHRLPSHQVMIATSTTTELDGSTEAEHYAHLLAEDNEGVEVDFIHGGDEECAPFFTVTVDGGGLSDTLLNWARQKGWEVGEIRDTSHGTTVVRFTEQDF